MNRLLEIKYKKREGTSLFFLLIKNGLSQSFLQQPVLLSERKSGEDHLFEILLAALQQQSKQPEPKEEKKEKPKRSGGTKMLEKQVAAAEREVEKAEIRMDELTQEMEENSANYLKLQDLCEQRNALEEELAHLYAVWENLAAELEEARG